MSVRLRTTSTTTKGCDATGAPRDELLQGADAPPPGTPVVLPDRDGEIELSSPQAVRWLVEHHGAPEHPGWLPRPVADRLALPPRPPLVSDCEGRRLTVCLLPGDPHALLLEEAVTRFRPDALDRLGLTGREIEILRAATVIDDEAELAWELFLSLHVVRERLARLEAKLRSAHAGRRRRPRAPRQRRHVDVVSNRLRGLSSIQRPRARRRPWSNRQRLAECLLGELPQARGRSRALGRFVDVKQLRSTAKLPESGGSDEGAARRPLVERPQHGQRTRARRLQQHRGGDLAHAGEPTATSLLELPSEEIGRAGARMHGDGADRRTGRGAAAGWGVVAGHLWVSHRAG